MTNDLQAVLVEMVLNYRLLPEKAPEVYQKIGVDFANVIILPAAQEVLKANTALHVANEILRQRSKIKLDVQETLTTWLAKYGVELKEAALANIRFDKAYEKAIADKQIEEQRAEQKLYELTQAQRQAKIVAATAKGQGDAARAQAEGEADAHPNSNISCAGTASFHNICSGETTASYSSFPEAYSNKGWNRSRDSLATANWATGDKCASTRCTGILAIMLC